MSKTIPRTANRLPAGSRRLQSGAVSLLVALLLLLGGTIIAFFANRGFIFEQRTSANQYRATKAFELAEAGAEWAIGKLNENLPLAAGSSCATGGAATAATFRIRFASPQPSGGSCSATSGCLVANTTAAPGCRIDNAGVATCDCPTAAAASLGAPAADEQGRFAVRFATVAGDGTAVEIVSRGCVNTVGNTACDPTSTTVQSDATATVRVIAKVVPAVPAGPGAALTARSVSVSGGNLNVVNNHQPSNGITINAGGAVPTGSAVAVYSVPGTPSRESIRENDPRLNNVTPANREALFAGLFGQTLANYSTVDPDVIRIGNGDAASVMSVINSGVRNPRFFVDGDIAFSNNAIGSLGNEVVIVASGAITMGSGVTAHGVFHAGTDFNSNGDATVYGAVIARNAFSKTGGGTLNLVYDPSLWNGSSAPNGRLVRVPGSWRDKATDY